MDLLDCELVDCVSHKWIVHAEDPYASSFIACISKEEGLPQHTGAQDVFINVDEILGLRVTRANSYQSHDQLTPHYSCLVLPQMTLLLLLVLLVSHHHY